MKLMKYICVFLGVSSDKAEQMSADQAHYPYLSFPFRCLLLKYQADFVDSHFEEDSLLSG